MKRIAIIGANSYIARNLIRVLYEQISQGSDYEIRLYDIAPSHGDGINNYTSVNLLDEKDLALIDFDCDIIFMFAGKTGSLNGFDEYDTFIDVNEKILLALLTEYRKRKSTARIIFPSTRLIYKGKDTPLKENDEKEFKTVYAINKYACETYLQQYNRMFGVEFCIFRICIPYGSLISGVSSYGTAEFMLKKAMSGQNITLYGNGESRRTITYIGDLCNVMIEGALSAHCKNDIYNIGGENYSLREMAELISKQYGVSIEYVPWPEQSLLIETGDTVFDSTKLDSVVHQERKTSFKQWCLETLNDK